MRPAAAAFSLRRGMLALRPAWCCVRPCSSASGQDSAVLPCRLRDPKGGSRRSRKLREEGWIPGIIHGIGDNGKRENITVAVALPDVHREFRQRESSFTNTPFKLQFEDGSDSEYVLANHVDVDPLGHDRLLTVNWLRWKSGQRVPMPLVLINDELSPALKRGAWVQRFERFLNTRVVPSSVGGEGKEPSLPSHLEVDLTGARVGDKIGLSRISIPAGLEPYYSDSPFKSGPFMGRVMGKKSLNLLDEEVGREEEEEEE